MAYQPRHGGYRDIFTRSFAGADLAIIATPIHELRPAAELAASLGYKNILVEKPGALYSDVLRDWAQSVDKQDVRIRLAFNRHTYPSFWKLKELSDSEGGMTSCRYTFTEWVHTINLNNNHEDVYQRWGIANSLHVIAMAHALIGMPKSMTTYSKRRAILASDGRAIHRCRGYRTWRSFFIPCRLELSRPMGIENHDSSECLSLDPSRKTIPLSEGFYKLGTSWNQAQPFPHVKEGVAEEVALMLDDASERNTSMAVTLADASKYIKISWEHIWVYLLTEDQLPGSYLKACIRLSAFHVSKISVFSPRCYYLILCYTESFFDGSWLLLSSYYFYACYKLE